MIDHTVVYI